MQSYAELLSVAGSYRAIFHKQGATEGSRLSVMLHSGVVFMLLLDPVVPERLLCPKSLAADIAECHQWPADLLVPL